MNQHTINIATYNLQVKRRRQARNISSAILEQLTGIAVLTEKLKRMPTISEVRREIGLESSSSFPALNSSPYVTLDRAPVSNGMTRLYKLTKEGEDLLTQILNPTK